MTILLKCKISIILVCLIIWGLGCVEEEIILPNDREQPEEPIEPKPIIGNEVGNQAPEFSLPDENGNLVSLSNYTGKQNVVLLFHTGST